MAIRSTFNINPWQVYRPTGYSFKMKPVHPIIAAYNEGRTNAKTVDLYHLLKKLGLRLTP